MGSDETRPDITITLTWEQARNILGALDAGAAACATLAMMDEEIDLTEASAIFAEAIYGGYLPDEGPDPLGP